MPNFLIGTINASAPTNVLVGIASGAAVAANTNRQGLVLTNVSDSTIYLGLDGNTAILNSGIVLLPGGGSWAMSEFEFNSGAVMAIAHTADSILCIQEFIR